MNEEAILKALQVGVDGARRHSPIPDRRAHYLIGVMTAILALASGVDPLEMGKIIDRINVQ